MKPTTADIIDSIIWSLDTYVAPEVHAPFASSVLLTVGNLLRHVKLRAQHEAEMLAEDNADLVAVLQSGVARLSAHSELQAQLEQVLQSIHVVISRHVTPKTTVEGVESLSNTSDELRQVLDELIRALTSVGAAWHEQHAYSETRQEIRGYLARQLKREGSLITPAFTGGRR